jgi:hypothetical protein
MSVAAAMPNGGLVNVANGGHAQRELDGGQFFRREVEHENSLII